MCGVIWCGPTIANWKSFKHVTHTKTHRNSQYASKRNKLILFNARGKRFFLFFLFFLASHCYTVRVPQNTATFIFSICFLCVWTAFGFIHVLLVAIWLSFLFLYYLFSIFINNKIAVRYVFYLYYLFFLFWRNVTSTTFYNKI